jgi:hypothetical protein
MSVSASENPNYLQRDNQGFNLPGNELEYACNKSGRLKANMRIRRRASPTADGAMFLSVGADKQSQVWPMGSWQARRINY